MRQRADAVDLAVSLLIVVVIVGECYVFANEASSGAVQAHVAGLWGRVTAAARRRREVQAAANRVVWEAMQVVEGANRAD